MEAPEFYQNTAASFCPPFVPEKRQYSSDSKAVAGVGDHFLVEEFLDFSNEDAVIADAAFNAVAGNSTNSSPVTVVDSCNSSNFSGCETNFLTDIGCQNFADGQFSSELCVPAYDDLAELEWVSNFVEESFSSEDLQRLQLISGLKARNDVESCHPETNQNNINSINIASTTNVNNGPIFNSEVSVPAKARSKRSRAPPCNWTSRLLLVSATSSSSSSSPEQDVVVSVPPPVPPSTAVTAKKTVKAAPKKKESGTGPDGQGRKCLHCATDKTPQWRTGPMGPKTLCNACGVRYKSGAPPPSQSDILADKALELAPEGSGAPTPEGFPQSSTTTTAPPTTTTIHSSSSSSERNGV
ncbi:GATA transcription factor 12 [Morus notabilis]|uniref:GATA transcription factor 12 n=1 Tax=Morus notabilis TaxID=981085 RepID=W9RR65_9ROSA|nr:GATA transcription factor 12 [Morus notabilis]